MHADHVTPSPVNVKPSPTATAKPQESAIKSFTFARKSPAADITPPSTRKPLSCQASNTNKFPNESKPSPPHTGTPLTASSPKPAIRKHAAIETVVASGARETDKKCNLIDVHSTKKAPTSSSMVSSPKADQDHRLDVTVKSKASSSGTPQSVAHKPQVFNGSKPAANPYTKTQSGNSTINENKRQYGNQPTLNDFMKKSQHSTKKSSRKKSGASSNSLRPSWLEQQKSTSNSRPNPTKPLEHSK